jgi:hypothetical protein
MKKSFIVCKLWALWFLSMVAVGTIALFLVYIRGKRMAATAFRFRRIDAMVIYLFGTMSGQGNF